MELKRKITLKHIARELDLSVSTVSKALKDSKEISQDTKDKVRAFAKLFHYRPNPIAVSLKNSQTKNIAVIVPSIVHHFFATVFRGIEVYARVKGYNVIVCVSDESLHKEVVHIEMLASGSVDGFIMSLSGETQKKKDFGHLKQISEQGIPLVLFDRVTDAVECDKVVINDREVAFAAVSKLIAQGRRRIALITHDDFSVSRERTRGYKDALAADHIPVDGDLILSLPPGEDVEADIRRFLKGRFMDAVLCVNEICGVIGMGIAQELGFSVPNDIAFIGFTDGILSKYAKPSMTSIAQHGEEMGRIAAEMLISRIEGEPEEGDETFRTEVIEATIIHRESTLG